MRNLDMVQELRDIDAKVTQLFGLVGDGLGSATQALLSGDHALARTIIVRDQLIDLLYHEIEEMVQRQFALQAPVATDMRYLLSMLRIVPELERSGDLVRHIAKRTMRDLASELSPRVRGLVERMGGVGCELWTLAAQAHARRDGTGFNAMRSLDDEMDELHVALIAEIVEAELRLPVAIDTALVGRFYERLGDHAVNIVSRLAFVSGRSPQPTE